MARYKIETRANKHSEDWQLFWGWSDWDTAYAAWKPEYDRQSEKQYEGWVNIRMIREDFGEIENCLIYNGWLQMQRIKQKRRDTIVAAVQYISIRNNQVDIAEWLQVILDNLEEVRGEEDYGRMMRG